MHLKFRQKTKIKFLNIQLEIVKSYALNGLKYLHLLLHVLIETY